MADDGVLDEDPDLYEITDFTTSTEWERFIASVEAVIHEWKLTYVKPLARLKEGELTNGSWEAFTEDIKFASFAFKITRHCLNGSTKHGEDAANLEDEPPPFALEDMMTLGNDFPPRAHYLVRWFGLRDFLVISPSSEEEAISNEDKTKLLISSVSIALTNSKCPLPVFVQLHHPQERLCYGVCMGGGLTTYFDMVHLSQVPQPFRNLAGLISLFKSKLPYSSQQILPPIQLTIRFTYLISDWSPYAWPQLPPDLTDDWFDMQHLKLGKLPFGALEDPITEMQLSVTWPSIPEDLIVDNDVYSDLYPLNAPKWSVRIRWKENPHCLMEEYLRNFSVVCNMRDSLYDVLTNMAGSEDISAKTEILDTLDRLAHQTPLSFKLPQMTWPEDVASSHRNALLGNRELLVEILAYIFLTTRSSPQEKSAAETSELESPSENAATSSKLLELKESLHLLKTTHPNSLLWRLALAVVHVYHTCGGVEALAQLWIKVVSEVRYYWDNSLTLPSLEPGAPNLAASLLHQKLQMLNCCIERKKKRERRQLQVNDPVPQQKLGSSESDEDIFYECPDDIDTEEAKESSNEKETTETPAKDTETAPDMPVKHEGVLRRCGDMTLLETKEPLNIPITQEPSPMTEDMLEQHAEALVKLGSNAEGAILRARMQSACLFSDMEAFKAANPGATLSDFVRWYSPRDWVPPVVDKVSGKVVEEGHLSNRMQLPGNTWQEVWDTARAVPAHRQKRLFDDTKEAEKVLYYLLSLQPAEIVKHLMPILIHSALSHIIDQAHNGPKSLATFLEQAVAKIAAQLRTKEPKYKEILGFLYEAEIAVARHESLRKKFDHGQVTADKSEVTTSGASHPRRPLSAEAARLISTSESAVAEVDTFALDLVDNAEVDVPGAGAGPVGKMISQLFVESQGGSDSELNDKSDQEHKFPSPVGREYILRARYSRPTPAARNTPQRMYCVMAGNDFRLAGAFTHDSVFY